MLPLPFWLNTTPLIAGYTNTNNKILLLIKLPEKHVFSLRYGDLILFFYLDFVPDIICFFKVKYSKNLLPGTNDEKVLLFHQSLK